MNGMNPMQMMQIVGMIDKFKKNHPKVFPFFKEAGNRVTEGAVIEIKITDVNGESLTSNIRVTADDIQMVETMKNMGFQQ